VFEEPYLCVLSQAGARLLLPVTTIGLFRLFVPQGRKNMSCRHKVLTEKKVGLVLARIGGVSTVLAATSF